MRWEETVMPKYRLCGARITRGANFKLLTLGMLLTPTFLPQQKKGIQP